MAIIEDVRHGSNLDMIELYSFDYLVYICLLADYSDIELHKLLSIEILKKKYELKITKYNTYKGDIIYKYFLKHMFGLLKKKYSNRERRVLTMMAVFGDNE